MVIPVAVGGDGVSKSVEGDSDERDGLCSEAELPTRTSLEGFQVDDDRPGCCEV